MRVLTARRHGYVQEQIDTVMRQLEMATPIHTDAFFGGKTQAIFEIPAKLDKCMHQIVRLMDIALAQTYPQYEFSVEPEAHNSSCYDTLVIKVVDTFEKYEQEEQ